MAAQIPLPLGRFDRFDFDLRVDPLQSILGRDRLGQPLLHMALIEEYLPLQVGGFHDVAVDDRERADPGPGQVVGHPAPERPAADDDGVRRGEAFLTLGADAGEEDTSRG